MDIVLVDFWELNDPLFRNTRNVTMHSTGHNFHYCHDDSTQVSASKVPFNLDSIRSLKTT